MIRRLKIDKMTGLIGRLLLRRMYKSKVEWCVGVDRRNSSKAPRKCDGIDLWMREQARNDAEGTPPAAYVILTSSARRAPIGRLYIPLSK